MQSCSLVLLYVCMYTTVRICTCSLLLYNEMCINSIREKTKKIKDTRCSNSKYCRHIVCTNVIVKLLVSSSVTAEHLNLAEARKKHSC